MKIPSLKFIVSFASLLLLLTITPVREPSSVSHISDVKTDAVSVTSLSAFAPVTTQGDAAFIFDDQTTIASGTSHSAPSILPAFANIEREATLARGKLRWDVADGVVPPAAVERHKPGYSISGRIVDINKQPVSGGILSINGVVGAVTDGTGYYTITDLAAGAYTVAPSKRAYGFSPALRMVDLQADEGEQDFVVEPDLGFRPERDGYSFNNPGRVTPDCLAFQRSFSGADILCSGDQPQPKFLALFERYKFSFGSGICTGMAATSLAYYVRSQAAPRPGPTFNLTFEESWSDIATFHGRQYSKAVLDRRIHDLSTWDTADANIISQRVDQVYRQLRGAVQPDSPDPVVIDLVSRPACETSGHTVTPYRLDETDPQRPKVYVYENFAAGDSTKFIQFDFSSPEHRFSYWKWDSASCGALIAIPISAYTSPKDKVPSSHLGQDLQEH